MPNAERAYIWFCQDFAEGEAQMEKFAVRLRTNDDAEEFKKQFDAAQVFNTKAKAGDDDLVWADTVEDVEEVVDDIDTNKTADGGDE